LALFVAQVSEKSVSRKMKAGLLRPVISNSPEWFDAYTVVHGFAKSLLATQISLRRLHGNVSQQELNLFQFSAGTMTKPRA
jgi:hypothetical protein